MTVGADVSATVGRPAPWADRTGRGLVAFDAVATLVAFADGVMKMGDMPDDRLLTEAWRTFAYLVFAGLWALLAVAPRRQRGLWELVLLHKIVFTVFAFAMIGDVPEAQTTGLIDLGLVVTTGLAYVLCRGWYAWRTTAPRAGEQ
jgi:peptidoglycan/LPS O-acetylase OafA/YrhL